MNAAWIQRGGLALSPVCRPFPAVPAPTAMNLMAVHCNLGAAVANFAPITTLKLTFSV